MPQLRARPTHAIHAQPRSLTRSMATTVIKPTRYYLLPLRVNATPYTVTAIPKWIDKHQGPRATNPQASASPRPLLLDVVVVVLIVRWALRGSSGRR